MYCLYCHTKIPRLRAWRTGSKFCSEEHAELYKTRTLERLLGAEQPGAAAGEASQSRPPLPEGRRPQSPEPPPAEKAIPPRPALTADASAAPREGLAPSAAAKQQHTARAHGEGGTSKPFGVFLMPGSEPDEQAAPAGSLLENPAQPEAPHAPVEGEPPSSTPPAAEAGEAPARDDPQLPGGAGLLRKRTLSTPEDKAREEAALASLRRIAAEAQTARSQPLGAPGQTREPLVDQQLSGGPVEDEPERPAAGQEEAGLPGSEDRPLPSALDRLLEQFPGAQAGGAPPLAEQRAGEGPALDERRENEEPLQTAGAGHASIANEKEDMAELERLTPELALPDFEAGEEQEAAAPSGASPGETPAPAEERESAAPPELAPLQPEAPQAAHSATEAPPPGESHEKAAQETLSPEVRPAEEQALVTPVPQEAGAASAKQREGVFEQPAEPVEPPAVEAILDRLRPQSPVFDVRAPKAATGGRPFFPQEPQPASSRTDSSGGPQGKDAALPSPPSAEVWDRIGLRGLPVGLDWRRQTPRFDAMGAAWASAEPEAARDSGPDAPDLVPGQPEGPEPLLKPSSLALRAPDAAPGELVAAPASFADVRPEVRAVEGGGPEQDFSSSEPAWEEPALTAAPAGLASAIEALEQTASREPQPLAIFAGVEPALEPSEAAGAETAFPAEPPAATPVWEGPAAPGGFEGSFPPITATRLRSPEGAFAKTEPVVSEPSACEAQAAWDFASPRGPHPDAPCTTPRPLHESLDGAGWDGVHDPAAGLPLWRTLSAQPPQLSAAAVPAPEIERFLAGPQWMNPEQGPCAPPGLHEEFDVPTAAAFGMRTERAGAVCPTPAAPPADEKEQGAWQDAPVAPWISNSSGARADTLWRRSLQADSWAAAEQARPDPVEEPLETADLIRLWQGLSAGRTGDVERTPAEPLGPMLVPCAPADPDPSEYV